MGLSSALGWTRSSTNGAATLDELEIAVSAPDATPQTWLLYGQRLGENGRYRHAAVAYHKFLESEPYHREARFQYALALARANETEDLFTFLRDLVFAEPKLAVDLLDRRECQAYLSEPRFQSLQREARVQAMD